MTHTRRTAALLVKLLAVATLLAGAGLAVAVPPAYAHGRPCKGHKVRACVDLSRQKAWLMKDRHVVYGPVKIASGRKGYRSDKGRFHVTYKDRDHVSSIFHAPMPYSVFYNGGEAFHQGSRKVRSHGCIHLSHKSAKRFYHYLHKGDVVRVHH